MKDQAVATSWLYMPEIMSRSRCMHAPPRQLRMQSHVLRFYRDELDTMNAEHFDWQPYSHRILHDYLLALQGESWRAITPLIVFEAVEWHGLDRVMQLFEMQQSVRSLCDETMTLHGLINGTTPPILIGRYDKHHFALWEQRYQCVIVRMSSVPPILEEDILVNHEKVYHGVVIQIISTHPPCSWMKWCGKSCSYMSIFSLQFIVM